MNLNAISQAALALPPDQRMTLAFRLLASVEPDSNLEKDTAWEAEITARISRIDAGKSQTVPAAEVFARMREIATD